MIDGVHTLMVGVSLALKLAGNTTVPELDKKFQHFKATRSAAAGGSEAGSINITVEGRDTLSDLAQKYYGTSQYWPLLWDANRAVIGPNLQSRPSRHAAVSAAPFGFQQRQLQDATRRSPTWRNYP
jgi:nucleoid-associated protein YgaU